MTALAIVAVAELLLIAFLLWDRGRRTPDLDVLVGLIDRLGQRIQAPHAAVLEHDELVRAHRDEEYAPPAVVPDDDEGFWASREKLAELAMQQEIEDRGRD